MSINNCHTNDSRDVIIFSNERILIYTNDCKLTFAGNKDKIFQGLKKGYIYLTTHRLIFISYCLNSNLKSLSCPIINLRKIEVRQPVFGGNKIVADLIPEPNGGFHDKVNIEMTFLNGGAIEFAEALQITARYTNVNLGMFSSIMPYILPYGLEVKAPPESYMSPHSDPFYNYVPRHTKFFSPNGNHVYVYNMSPPYPGYYQPPGNLITKAMVPH